MTVRRPAASAVIVIAAMLAAAAALLAVALSGPAGPPTRQQQVQQIASQLRCPVCKDLSAADSPAPLARQMRQQIVDQLGAGVTEEAILQGFVDAYGPSVLMTPVDDGWGRAIRLLPFVVLGSAILGAALLLRRALGGPSARSAPDRVPALQSADRRRVELALTDLRREEP